MPREVLLSVALVRSLGHVSVQDREIFTMYLQLQSGQSGTEKSVQGPASDMDQLKDAVGNAAVGTGEVQKVIRESTFQPRAAAFTSLIQQCARVRAWQKALEVFQALQEMPGLKVSQHNQCQTTWSTSREERDEEWDVPNWFIESCSS